MDAVDIIAQGIEPAAAGGTVKSARPVIITLGSLTTCL
jgi:hypothetical protein